MRRGVCVNRHFAAIGVALTIYLIGSVLNVWAASLNGGVMPTDQHPGALYWLGDRFAIVGARAGFTRWASLGDFLIWAGELAIAMTWVIWAIEAVRAGRRLRTQR